jgi:hypothetical protein
MSLSELLGIQCTLSDEQIMNLFESGKRKGLDTIEIHDGKIAVKITLSHIPEDFIISDRPQAS